MLQKANRIRKQKEFDRFFGRDFRQRGGFSCSTKNLILKTLPTDKVLRFGFIISNKVDNRATVRNKIKRRLREMVRLGLPKIKQKKDVLIVVQKGLARMSYTEIKKELGELLNRARML